MVKKEEKRKEKRKEKKERYKNRNKREGGGKSKETNRVEKGLLYFRFIFTRSNLHGG